MLRRKQPRAHCSENVLSLDALYPRSVPRAIIAAGTRSSTGVHLRFFVFLFFYSYLSLLPRNRAASADHNDKHNENKKENKKKGEKHENEKNGKQKKKARGKK